MKATPHSNMQDTSPDIAQDDRLLAAAAEVFLDKGFAASSVDEIAAKAKASKITYYKHYGNKERLFEAVVLRQNKRFLADFDNAFQCNTPIDVALPYLAQQLMKVILTGDAIRFVRLLHAEADRFPALAQIFEEAGPQKAYSMLADYLRYQMELGSLRKDDPQRAAEHFLQLTTGELHRRILLGLKPYPAQEEIDLHLQSGFETFMRAYAPPR